MTSWKEFFQHNTDKILLIVIFHAIMALMVANLTNATLYGPRGEPGANGIHDSNEDGHASRDRPSKTR